jgi:hypothetical protein
MSTDTTKKWVLDLREEIGRMVRDHVEAHRYEIIIAMEPDPQQDDKADDAGDEWKS